MDEFRIEKKQDGYFSIQVPKAMDDLQRPTISEIPI